MPDSREDEPDFGQPSDEASPDSVANEHTAPAERPAAESVEPSAAEPAEPSAAEPADADLLALDDASDYLMFDLALREPALRSQLGLAIADADAELLLRHDGWARTYFRQWRGEPVPVEVGAPLALPRIPVALAEDPEACIMPTATSGMSASEPMEPVFLELPTDPPHWFRRGRPLRAAVLALAAGGVLAAGLVTAGVWQASAIAQGTAHDPFPTGLVGPDAPAAVSASAAAASPDPEASLSADDRLAADVDAALKLDQRTAAVPAMSGVVEKQVQQIADLACLSGYDDSLRAKIENSVAGRDDLGPDSGAAIADAIARYCAAQG